MSVAVEALTALRWNLVFRLAGQALVWCVTLTIMRLLTPADYGLIAMAAVFAEYAAVIAEIGLGAAVIQAAEVEESRLRQLFGIVILTNSGAALLLCLAAPAIAGFYREPRLTSVIYILALQLLISAGMVIPQALASRRLLFKQISMVHSGSALTGSFATLALAWLGYGYWSLLIGNLAATILQTAAMNAVAPLGKPPLFSLRGARKLVSFGGQITIARLLWTFHYSSDIFLAGRFFGKDVVGPYAVAKNVSTMPVSKIALIVTQVAFPAFARLQKDRESVAANLLRSIRLLTFFGLPVMWGMSSVAPELVRVVIGRQWETAILPIRLLALAMPLAMISNFVSTAVQGVGRAEVILRNAIVTTLVMPLAFLGGCYWGGTGLALVWVTAYPCVWLWCAVNYFRAVGAPLRAAFESMARPAGAGLMMYGAVTLVRWLLPAGLPGPFGLAALIASGAVAYGGTVYLTEPVIFRDAVKLVRTMSGSAKK